MSVLRCEGRTDGWRVGRGGRYAASRMTRQWDLEASGLGEGEGPAEAGPDGEGEPDGAGEPLAPVAGAALGEAVAVPVCPRGRPSGP